MAKAKASGFKGYTAEEVEEEGKKDLLVLKEMLGEQQVRRCFDLYIFLETYILFNFTFFHMFTYFFQFFFGDEPHSLDLVAFCHIAQILNVESEVACPLRDYMNEECKNLVGLYNRMKVNFQNYYICIYTFILIISNLPMVIGNSKNIYNIRIEHGEIIGMKLSETKWN